MVLDVPADTAPGSYTLAFNIGGSNVTTDVAHAAVTVD
jgi:hypothetical protein